MPFGIGKAIKRHKARKQRTFKKYFFSRDEFFCERSKIFTHNYFFSTTTERKANRAAMRGDYQAAAFHQNRADNLRFKANVGRRMYRRGMGVGPVVVAPRRAPVVVRQPVVVRRAPAVVAPRYGAPRVVAPVYHGPGYRQPAYNHGTYY